MKTIHRAAVVLFLALVVIGAAHSTQTENHGIHAVPAPGAVTIDGKLDDWDLSGQTLMTYDIETLRDRYSATIAMMYDRTNLYVGIHWKDPKPMSNIHDPHYQANKGWAGDSVQLRFKTDRISHVTAWYYADRREPAMQIDYGKSLAEAFGGPSIVLYRTAGWKMNEGVEMAFLKDADARGYVQEIKLPWKLISLSKPYGPGDRFNCGVELLWGSADWPEQRYADNLMPGKSSREFFWDALNDWGPVLLERKGHLHLPAPEYLVRAMHPAALAQGPIPIAYLLPRDARVTLAIDDAQGHRIRNLVPALPRLKGRNVEHWDGLDDAGKAVPPGSYRFKLLYHDPIRLNWAISFANPGNPTWNTSDGRGAFYADHTDPQAAAAAGDYVALACPMGEGGQPLIGCDMNGQRLWGQANRVAFDGGRISLATDGKTVWVASEGKRSIIYRDEIATGRYSPWNRVEKDDQGRPYHVLDLPVSDLPGVGADPKLGANMTAIAYRNGVLAVCLSRENKINLLNADTGEVRAEIPIPAPKSVVVDADGGLIALSEGRLLRLSADGRKRPFNVGGYPDGYGLAIDASRNVYLSVRGVDQNVKVFSPDGRLLREIGVRRGRPLNGPYDPNGMRNPAGIAIDGRGRLWVTEENDNPKRTSVWSAEGRLVKDLPGTGHYSSAGSLNPYDPTMGFADNTVYRLDWKTGTSRPVYSLHGSGAPDDLFPPVVNAFSRVVQHGGAWYVYTTDSAQGSPEVECTMFRNGAWRSAAHTGLVQRRSDGAFAKYMSPLFAGHDGQAYSWADRNRDGRVQANELTFGDLSIDGKPARLENYYWGELPGPDGTIPYFNREAHSLILFPIVGYTNCLAPIYDAAHPKIVRVAGDPLGGGNGEGMALGGARGSVYLNQDPILAIDPAGTVMGSYPSHFTSVHGSHLARAARPGYLIGPSSIVGSADFGGSIGEVFDMNGNLGEHYLFTSDAMFVQAVFKDLRGGYETPDRAVRGMSFDDTTAGTESFGGNFIRAGDGKVYLTIGGTDARVLEVTGLDTLKRLPEGAFIYTPAQYQIALKLAEETAVKSAEPKVYSIARVIAPVSLDGKPNEWPELMDDAQRLLEIQDGPQQRYARVAARYDRRNLYLVYRVFAPRSAMKNAGQDDRLLFKTGDAVDLMLGPDRGSRNPPSGLRLLMTAIDGRPAVIVYRKAVPGIPADRRVPFSSPARTLTFDQVKPVPEVKLATGPIDGGYFVEAEIPWSVLGVDPRPGLKLRGDVGVLFADDGGTATVSRQYWSNKATGLVADVPGEADLTPDLWGTFVLQ